MGIKMKKKKVSNEEKTESINNYENLPFSSSDDQS